MNNRYKKEYYLIGLIYIAIHKYIKKMLYNHRKPCIYDYNTIYLTCAVVSIQGLGLAAALGVTNPPGGKGRTNPS